MKKNKRVQTRACNEVTKTYAKNINSGNAVGGSVALIMEKIPGYRKKKHTYR